MALDQEIEILDLPTEGKFLVIQLMFQNRPVMQCGYGYHSDLLKTFLTKRGIKHETREVRRDFDIIDIALEKGTEYELIGAGKSEICTGTRNFTLPCGGSIDYIIGPNHDFGEQLKKQNAVF